MSAIYPQVPSIADLLVLQKCFEKKDFIHIVLMTLEPKTQKQKKSYTEFVLNRIHEFKKIMYLVKTYTSASIGHFLQLPYNTTVTAAKAVLKIASQISSPAPKFNLRLPSTEDNSDVEQLNMQDKSTHPPRTHIHTHVVIQMNKLQM